MNKNRLLPSLRSLILPLSLAATPLTALAWPTLTIPTNALQEAGKWGHPRGSTEA